MKTCRECRTSKPFAEFPLQPGGRDGRHPLCKPCRATQERRRYERQRDAILERRRKGDAWRHRGGGGPSNASTGSRGTTTKRFVWRSAGAARSVAGDRLASSSTTATRPSGCVASCARTATWRSGISTTTPTVASPPLGTSNTRSLPLTRSTDGVHSLRARPSRGTVRGTAPRLPRMQQRSRSREGSPYLHASRPAVVRVPPDASHL